MKASEFCLCFPPLRTAGLKLDLTALYLAYTNTHTHTQSYCPSNCTAVESQQEVPVWLQPTCSVPDLVYIYKKKDTPIYSCTSHTSHCLTRSVIVQASLFILPLTRIIAINTLEAVWQPLRAFQLQGSVKRKHDDCFLHGFSIRDPWIICGLSVSFLKHIAGVP